MEKLAQQYVDNFMTQLIARNPNEPEFHQAVREVAESLAPYIVSDPVLQKMKILERIAEPERVVIFRKQSSGGKCLRNLFLCGLFGVLNELL